MAGFRDFLKSGHTPTLFAAFFYLMFSFVIWVMNGAMAPFISEQFNLTPAQKGLLLSIPIVAGAIMRFPLGLLAQYVGRKTATLVELCLITFTMSFGYFFVHTYDDLLKMALLLGVAGLLLVGYVLFTAVVKLDREARDRIFAAMFLIIGSILFWALFEQAGSSLNLYTDRYVDRAGVPASVTNAPVSPFCKRSISSLPRCSRLCS